MILADGEIYPSSEQERILDGLEERINATRTCERLEPETVIDAIDQLGQRIAAGEFNELIEQFGLQNMAQKMRASVRLLSRGYLERKLETELGRDFFAPHESSAAFGLSGVCTQVVPLGTLFHISAGNVDFLPAYTVAEGLLTGNVNLLKLPQADSGLTVLALQKLIEIQPKLKHFIYVFDTPSSDIAAMKRLADIADGIVVWGGDAAIRTVRNFAPVGAKLIEWGHRLSFAYLSGDWRAYSHELTALAEHIVRTEQLLCSSCQTIFLNTSDMVEIKNFCCEFLPYLEAARRKYPISDIGAAAECTLKDYTAALETLMEGGSGGEAKVFRGVQCSLTACEDSELELSEMFGHLSVKRLPSQDIMGVLRRKKGCLQTAGLLCDDSEFGRLSGLLIGSGVNRVTALGHMSETFVGESHDGEYSLRRYVRMVNIEYVYSNPNK